MSDCFKKNSLMIPGTRQDERLQKGLRPSYVQPDERSIADMLVFISGYAKLINFYSIHSSDQTDYLKDGDWLPLIQSDESFIYAGISVSPRLLPNTTFSEYLVQYETGSNTTERNEAYRVLWDILFSVYRDIDTILRQVPITLALHSELKLEISNNLVQGFSSAAIAYLNDNHAIPSFDLQQRTAPQTEEYNFGFANTIIRGSFDNIWMDPSFAGSVDNWNDYIALLQGPAYLSVADEFFSTGTLADDQDRIDYSTIKLKQLFRSAFDTYARIISVAGDYLRKSLESNASHFAHHGLLLAFVKLFSFLQADMNRFTQRHLEFYYEKVLQLRPAAAVPDSAHVVLEPVKNIPPHLIAKGTAFNAGKDATGKQLLYKADNDLTVSPIKVEQIKTVYCQPGSSLSAVNGIYASAQANSPDGKGAAFNGDDHSWKGFGNNLNMASLGFCLAAPVLHLTEGSRDIQLLFTTDAAGDIKASLLNTAQVTRLLNISYTGEKQWEPLTFSGSDQNADLVFTKGAPNQFTIQITLRNQCKPMVGYDSSIYTDGLETIYPVLRFMLNQEADSNGYEFFRGIRIQQVDITTTVTGITGLSLFNEFGACDASKPVLPFGPLPKVGSSFYAGHTELEHKNITHIEYTLQWMDFNSSLVSYYTYTHGSSSANETTNYIGIADNNSFQANLHFLRNKSWNLIASNQSFLSGVACTLTANPTTANPLQWPDIYNTKKLLLDTASSNGFIRMELISPEKAFGHKIWPTLFAEQTIARTTDSTNTLPNPPYNPLLKTISLKYTATQSIALAATGSSNSGMFIHLYPFGVKIRNEVATLFPSFFLEQKTATGSFTSVPLESGLLIGISNVYINQNLAILLQVNEGTEDQSVDTPEVSWNYLTADGWKHLDKNLLAETTENLLQAGIVQLQVPIDSDLSSTILPAGLFWIMAGITYNNLGPTKPASWGLPTLLDILPNAVQVTFADQGNDPKHLASALPAGSISKLFESDSAIKSVSQPFASCNGKQKENGEKYYTRISERLRHKKRAITIWDYERLVLNQYPEVYMVKCLNHTGYETDCRLPDEDPGKIRYKENLPGHVLLIPVPFVSNQQAGNKFQPTLSSARLLEIQQFIHGSDGSGFCDKPVRPLHCQLATLLVENPKYETIKVNCSVKFRECLDVIQYRNQLGHDLNAFLSPWINGDEGKLNFGGKLHASELVYFMENRSYIDYVMNLTLEQKSGSDLLNTDNPALAVASTSKSILTAIGTDEEGNPLHSIVPL